MKAQAAARAAHAAHGNTSAGSATGAGVGVNPNASVDLSVGVGGAVAGAGDALDTISERSGHAPKSPVYQHAEVPPSCSSDVGGGAGGDMVVDQASQGQNEGPKKVQKGQIHALAKMLSALKANRGAH